MINLIKNFKKIARFRAIIKTPPPLPPPLPSDDVLRTFSKRALVRLIKSERKIVMMMWAIINELR